MKPLYLLAASGLALTAAACGPKTPPVRASLECPATQGDLTRTGIAADGKACTYVTSGGAEVSLQLVAAPGGADAALAAIETNLLANRAAPKADAKTGNSSDTVDRQVDKAVAEATQDTKGVSVDIKLDDKHSKGVVTDNDGTTRVNLPGIHIVANDHDDTANVRVGPITVDANDGAATIRMRRDVRLRGEALNPQKRGLRAMFIYTGEDLPEGYRFVGYEAGGPKVGPITVAIVKSKTDDDDGGDIYPDVKKLVRKNGGV